MILYNSTNVRFTKAICDQRQPRRRTLLRRLAGNGKTVFFSMIIQQNDSKDVIIFRKKRHVGVRNAIGGSVPWHLRFTGESFVCCFYQGILYWRRQWSIGCSCAFMQWRNSCFVCNVVMTKQKNGKERKKERKRKGGKNKLSLCMVWLFTYNI